MAKKKAKKYFNVLTSAGRIISLKSLKYIKVEVLDQVGEDLYSIKFSDGQETIVHHDFLVSRKKSKKRATKK